MGVDRQLACVVVTGVLPSLRLGCWLLLRGWFWCSVVAVSRLGFDSWCLPVASIVRFFQTPPVPMPSSNPTLQRTRADKRDLKSIGSVSLILLFHAASFVLELGAVLSNPINTHQCSVIAISHQLKIKTDTRRVSNMVWLM